MFCTFYIFSPPLLVQWSAALEFLSPNCSTICSTYSPPQTPLVFLISCLIIACSLQAWCNPFLLMWWWPTRASLCCCSISLIAVAFSCIDTSVRLLLLPSHCYCSVCYRSSLPPLLPASHTLHILLDSQTHFIIPSFFYFREKFLN